MFEIEKGIPISKIKKSDGCNERILRQMEIGDSSVFPRIKQSGIFVSAAKCGIKITTRKISVDEIRVWRIA